MLKPFLKYLLKCFQSVLNLNLRLNSEVFKDVERDFPDKKTVLGIFETIPEGVKLLTEKQYRKKLGYSRGKKSPLTKKQRTRLAFDLVVENRKFEIELYWKRATYFWAFIASTFIAYMTLAGGKNFCEFPTFIVICIGFILSTAWYYTNLGSKTWQRHWEKHLDLLEDQFTGPLYKSVFETKTYSVSKINVIVSFVFRVAWLGLALDYLSRTNRLNWNWQFSNLDKPVFIAILVTVFTLVSMNFGYGRGRFKKRTVKVYERL